jgi:ketosteroid isomerase-like protein
VSADNAAVVRRFVDAFNRRDFDALVADLSPEVALYEWPEAPGAQSYRGPDGMRRAIDNWFESWEWMQIDVEDVQEAPDRVMAGFHQRAQGRGSEAQVEIRTYNVWSFEDGTVREIRLFTDRESALAAFGA